VKFAGGFDGCLDFNLMEAFRNSFAYGDWNAENFASFLTRHEAFFPDGFSCLSFLDNHDMNRYLWAAGGNQKRLRLVALCQFTLSGPPIIYYGTEVGLSQLRDVRQDGQGLPEESRLPMLWGERQDNGLLEFYRQLIRLRKNHPALTYGKMKLVIADQNKFIYTRGKHGEYKVVLNLSPYEQIVDKLDLGDKILMQTNPGDVQEEESALTLASLGGAVILKNT
jgi:cyclomaltodextrinase / maltogenic alpha-amylase / neopullulanase